MKRAIYIVISALMITGLSAISAGASEVNVLIDKLVEKGVLTTYDAQILKAETERKTAEKELKENFVRTRWDKNLKFETPDGKFKGEIGGRIHGDALYLRGQRALKDEVGDLKDQGGPFFRRARLYFQGSFHDDFSYKLQWDFASSAFADAYMRLSNIPYIGRLTVGQFKEPFSLEELTSSNNMTFVERALPNVFSPGRSYGAAINNNWMDQRVTMGIGAFGNLNSREWNLSSRITALPWYESQDKLFHVGVSHTLRKPSDSTLRFRQRPDMRTDSIRFVDTGDFRSDWDNRLGAEAALVFGPLSLQGEFIQAFANMKDTSRTAYLHGAYGYASYFLTGENRRYSKSSGAFSSVSPKENFSLRDGAWGAFELAGRYSTLNLNDSKAGIEGGILNNITGGINWYLNPNMRILINYVHSHRNGVGHADGVQGRFQVTF